jgi:hypothetical protein
VDRESERKRERERVTTFATAAKTTTFTFKFRSKLNSVSSATHSGEEKSRTAVRSFGRSCDTRLGTAKKPYNHYPNNHYQDGEF